MHYRRQHYLGRYQLAVDAALVYEESARVLKGAGWKVNFRSRGECVCVWLPATDELL
jgi:hypothetical protein